MSDNGKLSHKKCTPCSKGTPPLKGEALRALVKELGEGWTVIEEHHLEKSFKFADFKEALAFTNAVGALAELEGHHPDLALSWGKVVVTLWTHKVGGLSENDFILASKIQKLV